MSAQHTPQAASFTPGPWRVSEVRSGDGAVWVRVDLGTLGPQPGLAGPHTAISRADLSGATNKRNADIQRANARLIAAAPDLLEALETALAAWDAIYVQTELQRAQRQRHASEICRAALAKAREG